MSYNIWFFNTILENFDQLSCFNIFANLIHLILWCTATWWAMNGKSDIKHRIFCSKMKIISALAPDFEQIIIITEIRSRVKPFDFILLSTNRCRKLPLSTILIKYFAVHKCKNDLLRLIRKTIILNMKPTHHMKIQSKSFNILVIISFNA